MILPMESSSHPSNMRMNSRLFTQIKQNFNILKHLSNSSQLQRSKCSKNKYLESTALNFSFANIPNKTINNLKSTNRKNGGWVNTTSNTDENRRVEATKQQMLVEFQKRQQNKLYKTKQHIQQIFQICEHINANFYSYRIIQYKIKQLNKKIKSLKSSTCQFYSYVISALILYQYSNLTLTIFYFDKALKTLYHHHKKTQSFNYLHELMIYKYTSKVFLQTNALKQAKDMAYMYLRKTWRYFNLDQEMNAYDLLGQIQLELGNIEMSRYFHWRMCHAIRESKELVQISNQELAKIEKVQHEFNAYEDITAFIKNGQGIVDILVNHFRAEAEEEAKGFADRWKNKHVYLYTHRSSNRVLRNHRSVERRLIDEKQSKELHFIRPKDIKILRKLITEFNSFIFDLKRQWEIQILKQEMENINSFSS